MCIAILYKRFQFYVFVCAKTHAILTSIVFYNLKYHIDVTKNVHHMQLLPCTIYCDTMLKVSVTKIVISLCIKEAYKIV